jgi:uncharacterized membrane protein YcaP (DUF421 family)
LIKGSSRLLVQEGQVDKEILRKVHMTHRDLEEALRQQGVEDVGQVKEAHLERDGSISVIEK